MVYQRSDAQQAICDRGPSEGSGSYITLNLVANTHMALGCHKRGDGRVREWRY